jgi:hypothetical protein
VTPLQTTRPYAHITRDIKEVQTLLASRGWAAIRETLQSDVDAALAALASSRPMTPDEVHYRRGALAAALNMARLPEAVLQRLENDRALHPDAIKAAGSNPPKRPATAGQKA